jgi:hypothetical protein
MRIESRLPIEAGLETERTQNAGLVLTGEHASGMGVVGVAPPAAGHLRGCWPHGGGSKSLWRISVPGGMAAWISPV